MFTDAKQNWELDRLLRDLGEAKGRVNASSKKELAPMEQLYLQGILCGVTPTNIAKMCQVTRGTVASCLSNIYIYIRNLEQNRGQSEVTINQWSDVPFILERWGYKKHLLSRIQPDCQSSWTAAPDVDQLFGRDEILASLQESIIRHQQSVIALTGTNGVGKTALAVKAAKALEAQHDYSVFWRSMSDAPLLSDFLNQIQRLWGSQELNPTWTIEQQLDHLMQILQHSPRLVVLDAMESILEDYQYRPLYRDYMQLFSRVCKTEHQSCFLLTSSRQITNISVLRDRGFPVQSIELEGLDKGATRKLLEHCQVDCGRPQECDRIWRTYNGNPLFIKVLASTIQELFGGKLANFTVLDTVFLDEQVRFVIEHHWDQLSDEEKTVLKVLSRIDEPMTFCQLKQQLNGQITSNKLINAAKSLKQRVLIEVSTGNTDTQNTDAQMIYLSPVLKKYLSDYAV